jgi:hypothetical protein
MDGSSRAPRNVRCLTTMILCMPYNVSEEKYKRGGEISVLIVLLAILAINEPTVWDATYLS